MFFFVTEAETAAKDAATKAAAATSGEAKNEEHGAFGSWSLELHEHRHVFCSDLIRQLETHRPVVVVNFTLFFI